MGRLGSLVQRSYDQWRMARMRRQHGKALDMHEPTCPSLWKLDLRLAPDARVRIGAGVYMERQPGNHIWAQAGSALELGDRLWLRTEHGANRITLFPSARIRIGARGLLNGAMLHAKREIQIGDDCRLAFGVRVLDADLHDLDCETPERAEPISIGHRVWLGADTLVLRGVTIGDDVVVGAGSVVVRDLPSRVLAAGSPARPVRAIASRAGCR